MQAWIVKHIRLEMYFNPNDAARTRLDKRPAIFWHKAAAENAIRYMEVPDDWQVVEVEIKEK